MKRRQPFAFWQSITGSLDTGETPIETAARELHEETGIGDSDPPVATGIERTFTIDPRWLDRYAPGTAENREHEFRIRIDRDREIRIDPEEHSDWRWVPVDEAIELVWSWTNRDALEALKSDVIAKSKPTKQSR